MKREIIRALSALDQHTCSQVELSAGTIVSGYVIIRGSTPADEPYAVEFETCGKTYSCTLHAFLPRTQAIAGFEARAERKPAVEALAV